MDRDIHDFGHDTVSMVYGDINIDIDVIISKLIGVIWQKNIKTDMSCGGDPGGYVWINFCGITHARHFMSFIMNKFSLKKWNFRGHYMNGDKLHGVYVKFVGDDFVFKNGVDDPENIILTIAFPRTQIAKIEQCLQIV